IAIEQAAESIDKLVDGQIAGVFIENTSGVGTPVKINIRGQGSLTPLANANLGTSTQPLIIVDGVIMSEEIGIDSNFFDANGAFSENLSNPLAQISPENIESFTVLKDAAAVSIYGADGANGVIIITTKRGKKGKAKFGFSSQLGLSSAINQIEYMNGSQYNELRNEYLKNTTSNYTAIPYNGINTNWFDLLNGTGIYNKYNFNVSGGTSALSYRASMSYLKIEEPQRGNNTEQYNGNVNLGYRVDKLQINVSMNPSMIQKTATNIYYSYAFAPTLSPYNDDGNFSLVGVAGLGNPLAAIAQNKNLAKSFGLVGSIDVNYDFNENLKLKSLFGLDYKDKKQDRYFSGENESGRYNGSFVLNEETYPNYGRRLINERNSTKWNWQGQVLYDKQLNEDHHIDGLLGFELSKDRANFNYASGRGFINPYALNNISDALIDDNPATAKDESKNNQTFSDDISYNARVSLFSQVNYDYKKRYFLLGNFRRDQSSVFGNDSDIAYNGGAGVSWIVSHENWLNNVNWLDLLKLKTSYGTTGNSRIGSYRSKGLYTVSQNGYNGFINASPSAAPNGHLSWEKNTKFNLGIDVNIFKTVELSLEYYYDNIKDLITSRDIPTETGYSSIQLNAATMYNRGFELSSKIKWLQLEKLRWSTSFNISTLESKVTELVGLGSDFSTSQRALAQKVGHSTSTIWGINWVGIDPATGRDMLEKDGEIYDAVTYNSLFTKADWRPIGDSQPDAYGGFNNTISFNNQLSLSIRGTFQIGGDFLVSNDLLSNYNITVNRNLSVNAYDYWRQQGDVALQPTVTNNNPVIANQSKFLYDATYLKISNINLSYSIPVKEISFLDNLSLFVDASNVFYWYKEKSPADRNGIREFRFTYPQARTISLGLNTKF
ncbi:MAG: SusC/RagA family TonB-linked outer membrane protein, partial [Gelidibacter sp.]